MHITVDTGQSGYATILDAVRHHGRRRSPRGIPTLDLGHTVVELASPYHALPISTGRGISKQVAAVEAAQLIAGVARPKLMIAASERFGQFAEDEKFWGAYGGRINAQMLYVERKLRADPDTRQAVVTLWNPAYDNEAGHKDYPCTVALGFSLVGKDDRRLEMDVLMRSNDAWLGLPYDLFQFTQLQLTLARSLGAPVGAYRHTVWSLHLYGRDLDDSERLHLPSAFLSTYLPDGFGVDDGTKFYDAMIRAKDALDGVTLSSPTSSESWYVHYLGKVRDKLTQEVTS
jgi:thymidylate synthase